MKKTMLLIASCGLASGLAIAGQEQDTESYGTDPETTQDQSETTEYGTEQTDPAYQAEDRQSARHDEDLTAMSSSELEGKSVTTATGDEIGEIDAVWKSTSNDERIATVEVGGFLGIGEKTIAVPLSDLQQAPTGDGYQTSLTRSTIEAHPEFDESGYTREDGGMDEEGMMEQDEDTDY